MPIPDFQTAMLPLVTFLSDDSEHSIRETIDGLADVFNLTKDERQQMLPSGADVLFDNRIRWAKFHLTKAGLIESPRRSILRITQRGKQILRQHPSTINMQVLRQFPEYVEFQSPKGTTQNSLNTHTQLETAQVTPEEALEDSYLKIRETLAQELLVKIKQSPPAFFERLVVDLLVKMGYGGSVKDAGMATRFTNDEGIDGIIKEDKLGLDVVYIQAKRWDSAAVGRPDVQSFVGALDGQRANKGIFITTSRFAETAAEYVKTISKKVILIDGQQLANYMIDYNVGTSNYATYELKRIDSDYFGE